MKIFIDAMGGDNAPFAIVEGAVQAVKAFDCTVGLVGVESEISAALEKLGGRPERLEIIPATQIVTMEDEGPSVMRHKKDSSMMVGLNLLKAGEGDAFISAGNTGALLSCATLVVGRIKGVRRAAIASVLPTAKGNCVLLDSGANAECTPEFLLQFGYLGSFYAEKVLGIPNPRVGLLNNGTEEIKGTPTHKEAHQLLKAAEDINFIGNVEARGVPLGDCDVCVADGFSGNVFMKGMEGTAKLITGMMKEMFLKNLLTKLCALVLKGSIDGMKKRMDYKEVGGAPLLGLNRSVIKAHGSSDAKAIKSAVRQAIQYAGSDVCGLVGRKIGQTAG